MVNDSWRSAGVRGLHEEKVGGKNNKERWKEYKRENKWDDGRVALRRVYRFIGFSSIKKENEFSLRKSAAAVAAADDGFSSSRDGEQLRGEWKKKEGE